jgi:hypothetical protein
MNREFKAMWEKAAYYAYVIILIRNKLQEARENNKNRVKDDQTLPPKYVYSRENY